MHMQEDTIWAEAANGMMVRIPISRYEAWKAEQEKIKRGESTPDPEIKKQLRSSLESK